LKAENGQIRAGTSLFQRSSPENKPRVTSFSVIITSNWKSFIISKKKLLLYLEVFFSKIQFSTLDRFFGQGCHLTLNQINILH